MAAITDTRTMNMIWAHVREKVLPVMQNQWWKEVPLLKKMEARGNVKMDGGARIDVSLEVEEGSFEEFDGYQLLTLEEKDPFKRANINWNFCHVPLQVNRADLTKIRGKEKLFDLLKNKLSNAQHTMRKKINQRMFDDGTNSEAASNPFYGLKAAVPAVATNTYCGINRATASNSWWRNHTQDVTVAYTWLTANGTVTTMPLITYMNEYIRKVQQNTLIGGKNLCIITGTTVMGYLEDLAFRNALVLVDAEDKDLGIPVPKHKGVSILNDDVVEDYKPGGDADNGLYILNTDFLKWYCQSGCNFLMDAWEKATQQFAMTSHIWHSHQMLCTNPRYQAVLWGIGAPTSS